MADPKPPALDTFKAALKAGAMPDDYPAEALARLALDLRAAEAFVKTPEGALAVGVHKTETRMPFRPDEAWVGLSFERRLALAEAIGRYRRESEAASREANAPAAATPTPDHQVQNATDNPNYNQDGLRGWRNP